MRRNLASAAALAASVLFCATLTLADSSAYCPGLKPIGTAASDTGEGGIAAAPFQITSRWTSTATPSTGTQGTPITLRYSFARDGAGIAGFQGEASAGSNLIANFDAKFGAGVGGSDLTQRPWFHFFSDSFNRWSQLSGVTYTYEANDDTTAIITQTGSNFFGGPSGTIGVRGDVRIGGHTIDGPSSILAYNLFPNFGDMVVDTSETTLLTDSANSYRSIRNILTHESGHGLGILHVDSNTPQFLMQPFLATTFDGPQIDDILAVQRHYGDAREKTVAGNNDTFANATALGSFPSGGSTSIGTSASNGVVAITDTDFVSIDDETDADVFSFSVSANSLVTLTLTPKGPTYLQGPQNGAQTTFNAAAQSDLTLELLGLDGTPLLLANNTGLSGSEAINAYSLTLGGTYYARIAGLTADAIQLYRLDLAIAVPEPTALAVFALLGLGLRRRRAA